MKICSKCKIPKTLNEFHKAKHSNDGYNNYCKECRRSYQNLRYDYKKAKDWELQRKYGITFDQFVELYDLQKGCCEICGKFLPLKEAYEGPRIDHNHKTGKVRGILCIKCNNLLGQAEDNVLILSNAIKYLTR